MNYRKRQAGLSIATALFVITAMALLAAMIFQLIRSNADTTGEEVLLIRSFYAAQSGIHFVLRVCRQRGATGAAAIRRKGFSESELDAGLRCIE